MMVVFLTSDSSLLLLSKDKSFHVLYYILRQLNNTSWIADSNNKQFIIDKLAISSSTLDKQISSLKQRGVLKPSIRGQYLINTDLIYIDT